MSVAKRDDRGQPILWKASISLGIVTIDGKRRRNRPTEYAETEAEAHRLLKQLQAQYLSGDDMTAEALTIEAVLLRWLAHVKLVRTPGTHETHESHCRCHLIPTIGGLKARALRTAHVQAMLDALVAKGRKPSTVKGIRATLIRALTMAKKWGLVEQNVALDTEIPPIIQKRPQVLNDAQLDRLLDAIAGDPLEPIVIVALGTGWRISEVLGLLWGDVDYDQHELRLSGAIKRRKLDTPRDGHHYELVRESLTKTKDERAAPTLSPIEDALRARWQQQKDEREKAGRAWQERGLVFTDDCGRPLDPRDTSRAFKKLAKRAGLPPGFTFHSLRHSVVTFLIAQGEQQRTIMQIVGHRSSRTTDRYGAVLPETTRDALTKHGERLKRRGGEK